MQIKFSIALVMIVINSTFYSDITVAKEKMIFAGVSMGIAKEDLVKKLTNENNYLVNGGGGYRNNNFTFIFDKDDRYRTLYPVGSLEDLVLIDNDNYDKWSNISTIDYGEIVLDNPVFSFSKNTLVLLSTSITTSVKYYISLVQQLTEKYGKPKIIGKDITFLKYCSGNDVIIISNNENYKQHVNRKDVTVTTNIQFKDSAFVYKHALDEKSQEDNFYNNIISLSEKEISVFGLTLGMNKSQCVKILTRKFQIPCCKSSTEEYEVNYNSAGSDNNDQVYEDNDKMIDTTSQKIDYPILFPDGNEYILSTCYYKNRLYSINFSGDYNRYLSLIKTLELKYKDLNLNVKRNYPKGTAGTSGGESLEYNIRSEGLRLSTSVWTSQGYINLIDQSVVNVLKNYLQSHIKKEFVELISNLNTSEILCLKINSMPFKYNDITSYGNWEDIDPNIYSNMKRVILEHSLYKDEHGYYNSNSELPYSRRWLNDDYLSRETEGLYTYIQRAFISLSNDNISSISFDISTTNNYDNYFEDKDIPYSEENQINFTRILVELLKGVYGNPQTSKMNNRHSLYWKVNNNLLEVLIGDGKIIYTVPQVSFRKYREDDIIFNITKKRGLLD
jgi:hypothetical protein